MRGKCVHKSLVGCFAEKRAYRVFGNAYARPDNEQSNGNAHISVDAQPRQFSDNAGSKDGCGRYNVVSAVRNGCGQSGRIYLFAEF